MNKEQKIIDSWLANAGNWINIINKNGIESRNLATNDAIVQEILQHQPKTVLDIGCGEGWLAKALADTGIKITGIDAIPALIEQAKQNVPGIFFKATYEDIYLNKVSFDNLFDAIVINFALIGKESASMLLPSIPKYLLETGKVFIQTLHPHSRKLLKDYESGWKEGSWDGLGNQFTLPYQWYFRTMEDWIKLLETSGFDKVNVREVFHPLSGKPLSVIFTCYR